mmetsp:Transcript_49457/g.92577  ORF Transcript_49457/g.92577 Transcript_49457/m.92577 type:complete len:200 (+) Transcript_49457:831-1430(+)
MLPLSAVRIHVPEKSASFDFGFGDSSGAGSRMAFRCRFFFRPRVIAAVGVPMACSSLVFQAAGAASGSTIGPFAGNDSCRFCARGTFQYGVMCGACKTRDSYNLCTAGACGACVKSESCTLCAAGTALDCTVGTCLGNGPCRIGDARAGRCSTGTERVRGGFCVAGATSGSCWPEFENTAVFCASCGSTQTVDKPFFGP